MIIFVLSNNKVELDGADQYFLKMIDLEFRYPSEIAIAIDQGIEIVMESAWDGWVRFLHRPKTKAPWFPAGLLDRAIYFAEKYGYQWVVHDTRERPQGDIPEVGVKIELRDYQQEAVEKALAMGRGVLDLPPRSGKTRIACEIQRQLNLPTLWVAPTDRIVTQTHQVLEGFFGKNYCEHLVGRKKWKGAANKRVVVCTAATAVRLPPEFFQSRQCLMIDEFHHSSAKSYHEIMKNCDHVFYRFGMTGTFFRSGEDAMAMHALLANTIYRVTSAQLLNRGYLVPTYAVFLPVDAPRLYGVSGTYMAGHGKYGIHEHEIRQKMVVDAAKLLWQSGRTVLILVGTKRQGYMLRDMIKDQIPISTDGARFGVVEFVSTDVQRKIQGEILESFANREEVKILIGTSLLGEGVDIPTADALVYARGEKAEVSLVQNMYRVCTAQEDKRNAVVVDFADRHNRKLMRHSEERLRVYHGESTFAVSILDTSQQFSGWLERLSGV